MKNDYQKNANLYAKLGITGTRYLIFKQIGSIIEKYAKGNITLDYGCGAGGSTRFLKSLGLSVEGVDISEDMLTQARSLSNDILYTLIESAKTKAENEKYDIVFSSLVLFEIATKEELARVFREIWRILKQDGVFIAVTGSPAMFNYQWLSLEVDFPENKELQSGSIAKVLLKDINLIVYDYFWTDGDYQDIIRKTHFDLVEAITPLGDENDGYPWVSEKEASPFIIYVMKKKNFIPAV